MIIRIEGKENLHVIRQKSDSFVARERHCHMVIGRLKGRNNPPCIALWVRPRFGVINASPNYGCKAVADWTNDNAHYCER